MQRRERIPLHDHADRNSGGLVAARTTVTQVISSGGSSSATPNASDVAIADTGGYFAGTNVEAALAELAALPLDGLSDVDTTGKADQDVLTWDDASSTWIAQAPAGGALAYADLTDVDVTGIGDGDMMVWDAGTSTWLPAAPGAGSGDVTGQFIAGFDGGGSVLSAGAQVDIVAPFTGTITGWTLLANVSGSAVVDIWLDVLGNYPPTDADSITAAAPPTLTSDTDATSTTLTGWTTAVTAGDVLRFNLDSASTVTRLLLVVAYTRP